MYNKKETDISYDYLKIIISKLKEPIIIKLIIMAKTNPVPNYKPYWG